MAAHLLMGLAETIIKAEKVASYDLPKQQFIDEVAASLTIGCWTDDDTELWRTLDRWVFYFQNKSPLDTQAAMLAMARELESHLPWVVKKWYHLGCPRNREEWNEARFRQGRKDEENTD